MPIIYTPCQHTLPNPGTLVPYDDGDTTEGTIWQCDDCQAIYQLDIDQLGAARQRAYWTILHEAPARAAALKAAIRPEPNPPGPYFGGRTVKGVHVYGD